MSSTQTSPPGGTYELGERTVARIGFGAMQLSGPGGRAAPSRPDAIAVLRRAVGLGVNHFDTADFYGAGKVNELIRSALAPYAADLVLSTKVGAREDEAGRLTAAQRPEQLRAGVEANLRSLGVERLDVVNLRRLDRPPGILAEGDQLVDLDSQLAELRTLCDEGKIDAIGLSNVTVGQLRQALPVGIACVQNAYSLLDRGGEPLLALCAAEGIAWVPFFPLGSAFAQIASVTDHPAVIAAARTHEATPSQVALAWLLAHARNVLLIPGTANVNHLEENVAAGALRLEAGAVHALDAAAKRAAGASFTP